MNLLLGAIYDSVCRTSVCGVVYDFKVFYSNYLLFLNSLTYVLQKLTFDFLDAIDVLNQLEIFSTTRSVVKSTVFDYV